MAIDHPPFRMENIHMRRNSYAPSLISQLSWQNPICLNNCLVHLVRSLLFFVFFTCSTNYIKQKNKLKQNKTKTISTLPIIFIVGLFFVENKPDDEISKETEKGIHVFIVHIVEQHNMFNGRCMHKWSAHTALNEWCPRPSVRYWSLSKISYDETEKKNMKQVQNLYR